MRPLAPLLACLALVGQVLAQPLPLDWPSGTSRRAWLLAYLGGSLVEPVPSATPPTLDRWLGRSPFLTQGSRVSLDLDALHPEDAAALASAAEGEGPTARLSQRAFRQVGSDAYLRRRPFPATYPALAQAWGLDGEDWSHVEVDSVISRSVRRIRFRPDTVLAAAAEHGNDPVYPPGTRFLAEELAEDGRLREVHVMRKRVDGTWDFALYDGAGPRRQASAHHPRRFSAPMSCAACHSSVRRFPPFREFPDPSDPIAGMTPEVRIQLSAAELQLVRARKAPVSRTADGVLGDYVGLAAVLKARRATSE